MTADEPQQDTRTVADRQAEADARLAEVAERLRQNAARLARQLDDLATAATAHGTAEGDSLAIGTRESADRLRRAMLDAAYERERKARASTEAGGR